MLEGRGGGEREGGQDHVLTFYLFNNKKKGLIRQKKYISYFKSGAFPTGEIFQQKSYLQTE